MAEGSVGALPWYQPNGREEASSAETNPGGDQPVRWVTVGVNLNPGEAMIIKGRLESEGIPALAQQEAVGSVLGLTVGPLGSVRILVPEPLAEQALALLAETFEVGEEEEEEEGGGEER